jgi:hypothetical protein
MPPLAREAWGPPAGTAGGTPWTGVQPWRCRLTPSGGQIGVGGVGWPWQVGAERGEVGQASRGDQRGRRGARGVAGSGRGRLDLVDGIRTELVAAWREKEQGMSSEF